MCSNKKFGCQAKATIKRVETIKDDVTVLENRLVAVSSPMVHAQNHQPDHAGILVENLIDKMKQEVRKNPLIPPGESNIYKLYKYFVTILIFRTSERQNPPDGAVRQV